MILLILTYLAGVLTILSPCILPVLPFVFSKAQGSFVRNGLPLLAGMALTFSLFSGIAILGGEWLAKANEIGRSVALIFMVIFGVSLIFPHLSESLLTPFTRLGSRLGQGAKYDNLGGSILIGMSTGLLWAPCAGPILGIVLTGAAAQGNVGSSLGLLLAYSLGACTSLAAALMAGQRFFKTLKRFLGVDQVVKKALGVAVLVGVVAIAFNLDRTLLTRISKIGTESIENKLLQWGGLAKPAPTEASAGEVASPGFKGAVAWLNSKPLDANDLKGKVVLVDFWTYSCINCLRTLPYLKAWNEKYKDDGLVIVGVHTPEFAFEKSPANVQKAVADLGITYPIAIDSNYEIWGAFDNEFWPAHYFVDRTGKIRFHHFGEGDYAHSEEIIRQLLSENGKSIHAKEATVSADGVEMQSAIDEGQSPETYVGYGKSENFVANQEIAKNQEVAYKSSLRLNVNQWSLGGKWRVEEERAVAAGRNGRVSFRFKGRDLHLVLGGTAIPFRVRLDGQAPGKNHGVDIDESGHGQIQAHRLYQLIRLQEGSVGTDHIFEIEFLAPGAEVYAFTFG